MNKEARDAALEAICTEWAWGASSEQMELSYNAGYRAARDEAIKILSKQKEQDCGRTRSDRQGKQGQGWHR